MIIKDVMRKNFKKVVLISGVLVVLSGWGIMKREKTNNFTDLQLANIEALANNELTIECDSYSVVIKCQKMCLSCGTIWTAVGGYGNAGNLKGKCSCGYTYS